MSTRSRAGEATLLRFLLASAEELGSSLCLEEVCARLAARVRTVVDCELLEVLLWNEGHQQLEPRYTLSFGERIPAVGGVSLGHGIAGLAAQRRAPIRVADVDEHSRRVRRGDAELRTRSALAVPLMFEGRMLGVLDLESVERDAFGEEHEQTLAALATHVAAAVRNAVRFESAVAKERRIERDQALAREIQKGLLPRRGPRSDRLDIGAAYLPARTLGGDFYDFISCRDGRLAVVAGDVAGKGTPAALYGSLAVGLLRGQLLERAAGPAEVLEVMNERLFVAGFENRFVALLFALFCPEDRTLTLANAGFSRPVHYRRGDARRLEVEGTPLGLLPDRTYGELRIDLEPGDVFAFCSDGLEDAVDGNDEHFGEKGLHEVVGHLGNASAQQIADGILRANTAYAGEYEEHPDDRSVVVLKMR